VRERRDKAKRRDRILNFSVGANKQRNRGFGDHCFTGVDPAGLFKVSLSALLLHFGGNFELLEIVGRALGELVVV